MRPDATRPVPAPATDDDAIISLRGVTHRFASSSGPVLALDDVGFDVPDGAFVSVVGPSGCGKSTLLQMLSGLLRPTGGELRFRDRVIGGPNPREISLIFQDASLFPWRTALDNVMMPAVFQRSVDDGTEDRARGLLELVGLGDFAGSYPHELSGGMRQRVSIARGLLQEPNVLLMDEPFGALDEQTREDMGAELTRIWSSTDVSVLFVTHSIEEALLLSDRVVVMAPRPGRVVEEIEVDLPRPRDADTKLTPAYLELYRRIRDRIRAVDTDAVRS